MIVISYIFCSFFFLCNIFLKADDPFTRRSTKPRMNFKAAAEDKPEEQVEERKEEEVVNKEEPKVVAAPTQVTQDDLFSAHDFDITIDLEVPLPSKF